MPNGSDDANCARRVLCTGSGWRASTSGPELFAVKGPPYARSAQARRESRAPSQSPPPGDVTSRAGAISSSTAASAVDTAKPRDGASLGRPRMDRDAQNNQGRSEANWPIMTRATPPASRSTDGRLER